MYLRLPNKKSLNFPRSILGGFPWYSYSRLPRKSLNFPRSILGGFPWYSYLRLPRKSLDFPRSILGGYPWYSYLRLILESPWIFLGEFLVDILGIPSVIWQLDAIFICVIHFYYRKVYHKYIQMNTIQISYNFYIAK